MAELLTRAATAGHHMASITRTLGEFLDHYGAPALQSAVLEALRRDVPHPNAVRQALEHAREVSRDTPLVVPQLSERALALDVHVPVRGLGAYDALQTTPSSPGSINQSDPS